MIHPTERSTVSISQPRILNLFWVGAHGRWSDPGKVWETDPASAVGVSARRASGRNTVIFIRDPPGPGVDSGFQHSAWQPVARRRPRRRLRPVAHDDDGGARARPAPERVEDDGAVGVVQVAGGLVGEEQRRVVQHRPAKSDPLLLAPRQLLWIMVLPADHAELVEQREPAPPGLRAVAPRVARREQDVLERGERRQQQERLEDEADPPPARAALRRARQRADAHVLVHDLARLGVLEESEDAEERALAGAGLPDDRDQLAALYHEVHPAQDRDRLAPGGPVRLHETGRPQHGAALRATPNRLGRREAGDTGGGPCPRGRAHAGRESERA